MPGAYSALYSRLDAVGQAVAEFERRLNGDPARQKLSEPETLSIGGRVGRSGTTTGQTRQMPTATQRRDLEIATAGLDALERDLQALDHGRPGEAGGGLRGGRSAVDPGAGGAVG